MTDPRQAPRRFLLAAVVAALTLSPSTGVSAQDQRDTSETVDGLPLAQTRTFSMTATEGSWLSLDVSPDGQTIVFDLLGDLYTLPVTGGTATRITSGESHEPSGGGAARGVERGRSKSEERRTKSEGTRGSS